MFLYHEPTGAINLPSARVFTSAFFRLCCVAFRLYFARWACLFIFFKWTYLIALIDASEVKAYSAACWAAPEQFMPQGCSDTLQECERVGRPGEDLWALSWLLWQWSLLGTFIFCLFANRRMCKALQACAMASSFCSDTWFVSEVSLLDLLILVDLNTECIYYLLEYRKITFAEGILSCRLDWGQVRWFCSQISLILLRVFCMISELKLPTSLKHQLLRKSIRNCWLLYNLRLDVLSIIVFWKYESAKECTKWSPVTHFLGFFHCCSSILFG